MPRAAKASRAGAASASAAAAAASASAASAALPAAEPTASATASGAASVPTELCSLASVLRLVRDQFHTRKAPAALVLKQNHQPAMGLVTSVTAEAQQWARLAGEAPAASAAAPPEESKEADAEMQPAAAAASKKRKRGSNKKKASAQESKEDAEASPSSASADSVTQRFQVALHRLNVKLARALPEFERALAKSQKDDKVALAALHQFAFLVLAKWSALEQMHARLPWIDSAARAHNSFVEECVQGKFNREEMPRGGVKPNAAKVFVSCANELTAFSATTWTTAPKPHNGAPLAPWFARTSYVSDISFPFSAGTRVDALVDVADGGIKAWIAAEVVSFEPGRFANPSEWVAHPDALVLAAVGGGWAGRTWHFAIKHDRWESRGNSWAPAGSHTAPWKPEDKPHTAECCRFYPLPVATSQELRNLKPGDPVWIARVEARVIEALGASGWLQCVFHALVPGDTGAMLVRHVVAKDRGAWGLVHMRHVHVSVQRPAKLEAAAEVEEEDQGEDADAASEGEEEKQNAAADDQADQAEKDEEGDQAMSDAPPPEDDAPQTNALAAAASSGPSSSPSSFQRLFTDAMTLVLDCLQWPEVLAASHSCVHWHRTVSHSCAAAVHRFTSQREANAPFSPPLWAPVVGAARTNVMPSALVRNKAELARASRSDFAPAVWSLCLLNYGPRSLGVLAASSFASLTALYLRFRNARFRRPLAKRSLFEGALRALAPRLQEFALESGSVVYLQAEDGSKVSLLPSLALLTRAHTVRLDCPLHGAGGKDVARFLGPQAMPALRMLGIACYLPWDARQEFLRALRGLSQLTGLSYNRGQWLEPELSFYTLPMHWKARVKHLEHRAESEEEPEEEPTDEEIAEAQRLDAQRLDEQMRAPLAGMRFLDLSRTYVCCKTKLDRIAENFPRLASFDPAKAYIRGRWTDYDDKNKREVPEYYLPIQRFTALEHFALRQEGERNVSLPTVEVVLRVLENSSRTLRSLLIWRSLWEKDSMQRLASFTALQRLSLSYATFSAGSFPLLRFVSGLHDLELVQCEGIGKESDWAALQPLRHLRIVTVVVTVGADEDSESAADKSGEDEEEGDGDDDGDEDPREPSEALPEPLIAALTVPSTLLPQLHIFAMLTRPLPPPFPKRDYEKQGHGNYCWSQIELQVQAIKERPAK